MVKKSLITLILVVFTLVSVAAALAQGPSGNKRKGKYTYRKVYKACMQTGEVQSETPPISPADKTMAQWKDIFENKKFDDFGCKAQWAAMSDDDLMDIYSYVYNYAADSPTPATCK